MKMQRRTFLKTVGATLVGGLGLGATKSLPKPVKPQFATGGIVGTKRIRTAFQASETVLPGDFLVYNYEGKAILPRKGIQVQYHIDVVDTKSMQAAMKNTSAEIARILDRA